MPHWWWVVLHPGVGCLARRDAHAACLVELRNRLQPANDTNVRPWMSSMFGVTKGWHNFHYHSCAMLNSIAKLIQAWFNEPVSGIWGIFGLLSLGVDEVGSLTWGASKRRRSILWSSRSSLNWDRTQFLDYKGDPQSGFKVNAHTFLTKILEFKTLIFIQLIFLLAFIFLYY